MFDQMMRIVEEAVETYVRSLPKVNAEKLGLDRRAGYVYVDEVSGVIISESSRSLEYYGCFEYADKYSINEYTFYTSESVRVQGCLAFWEENKEEGL